MNKTELIDYVANVLTPGTTLTREDARRAVDTVLDGVEAALAAGGEVMLSGFGKFSVVARPARQGRNPKTGEPISIPATRTVRFAPAKGLKGAVNG